MKTPALLWIPLCVIVTVVGWLTWTYLQPPAPLSAAKPKITEIEAGLLSPTLGSTSSRNPFLLTGGIAEKPDGLKASNHSAISAVSGRKDSASAELGRAKSLLAVFKAWLDGTKKQIVSQAKSAPLARASVADQVRLTATSIGGTRRLATLNDRVFAEGEVIHSLGTLSGPIVLAQVESSSVTLRYLGLPTVVNFSSGATAAKTGPSPAIKSPPALKRSTRAGKTKATPPRRSIGGRR